MNPVQAPVELPVTVSATTSGAIVKPETPAAKPAVPADVFAAGSAVQPATGAREAGPLAAAFNDWMSSTIGVATAVRGRVAEIRTDAVDRVEGSVAQARTRVEGAVTDARTRVEGAVTTARDAVVGTRDRAVDRGVSAWNGAIAGTQNLLCGASDIVGRLGIGNTDRPVQHADHMGHRQQ